MLQRDLSIAFLTERVLDIFEDDEIDRAMVDLAVVEALGRIQIDDHRAAKMSVDTEQVASDLTVLSLNERLREAVKRLAILEILKPHGGDLFLYIFLVELLLKVDLEDGVAAFVKNIGELRHSAIDFIVVVIARPAVPFEQILTDEP